MALGQRIQNKKVAAQLCTATRYVNFTFRLLIDYRLERTL